MKIGIIGGSGLYEMEGLEHLEEHSLTTPFGDPSDRLISGSLHDKDVVFLPRHGKGHRLLPSEIPFRANVWAMKKLGVTHLISVSAVGSLKEEIQPGHIVFPDQFIDRTFLRESTFFGQGVIAHVQFGDPVCPNLLQDLAAGSRRLGIAHHRGGIYVCMEGPAFSTRAESNLYRSWGGAVIGMTNLQEAKLAREAELCFATIALATDYDCWHAGHESVDIQMVIDNLLANAANAENLLRTVLPTVAAMPRDEAIANAGRFAVITAQDQRPPDVVERLRGIIDGL